MDAAEAMNHIALAVQEAMGDVDDGSGPWLPLSVRYAAAEAAANVVIAYRQVTHPDRAGEAR